MMMMMVLRLVFFLSLLVSIKGPVSLEQLGISPLLSGTTVVHGTVGGSVQFGIQQQEDEFEELFWTFNERKTLMIYFNESNTTKVYHFKDKLEFSKDTHSLTLKNLQSNDTGYYEARASGKRNHVVARYDLSVLEPLVTPVLTAEPHQNNGTCLVRLTCKGHNLLIGSSCYNETCEQKKVASPKGVNLSLFLSGSSIMCNYSNLISWKTSSKKMDQVQQICSPKGIKNHKKLYLLIMLGTVLCILLFVAVLGYALQRKKNKTGSVNFDITPEFQNTEDSPKMFRMLKNARDAFTLYSAVKKPVQSPKSQPTINPRTMNNQREASSEGAMRPDGHVHITVGDSKPETIYATVNKISKTIMDG